MGSHTNQPKLDLPLSILYSNLVILVTRTEQVVSKLRSACAFPFSRGQTLPLALIRSLFWGQRSAPRAHSYFRSPFKLPLSARSSHLHSPSAVRCTVQSLDFLILDGHMVGLVVELDLKCSFNFFIKCTITLTLLTLSKNVLY